MKTINKKCKITALFLAFVITSSLFAAIPSTSLAVNAIEFNGVIKEIISGLEYDWIDGFSGGMAVVLIGDRENGKYGCIDKNGNVVVPLEYDWVYKLSESLLEISLGGKCGLIDTSGKIVVPCEYDAIGQFSNGMAWILKDGKYGYIDETGDIIIPMIYDKFDFF